MTIRRRKPTDEEIAEGMIRAQKIRRSVIRADELFDQWDREAADRSIKIKLPNPFKMWGDRRQSRKDDDR